MLDPNKDKAAKAANHLRTDGNITVDYGQAGSVLAELDTDEMDRTSIKTYPHSVIITLGDDQQDQ